jgi:uncharacterized membrane protein YtjA (UPF0391 family)
VADRPHTGFTPALSRSTPLGDRRDLRWAMAKAFRELSKMTILKWALLFFVISIVAGLLGFTGVSAASADVARVLFYIFVVIFIVLLVLGLTIFRV